MENSIAVSCTDLCKRYTLYETEQQRLRGLIFPRYKPTEFTALDNISLEIKCGEVFGLIGLNGSGKSTLSSIIAGVTPQTSGEIKVNGEVSMLAANSGLDAYLTGLENIRYKCLLMGLNENEIEEIREDIVRFADIGVYINLPLRTYSSGMRSRLGFAISVHMNPDILIIDEALSVGDNSFTNKCIDKIDSFKRAGKTIIFVTHAVTSLKGFCDRVMWIHKGHNLGIEPPERIIMPYCGFAREFNEMTSEERNSFTPSLHEYQEKYL